MIKAQKDSSLHNFVGHVVDFLDVLQYDCGVSSLPPRYAVNNPFVNLRK